MKRLRFSKLHGQGNDFVIIDATEKSMPGFNISSEQISMICNRHFGIGADGMIIVRDNVSGSDFFMDYYNQDGSTAEMCGNGIRCMARFISDKGLSDKKTLKIITRAGLKTVEILNNAGTVKREKMRAEDAVCVKVNMGNPIFEPSMIPVKIADKDLEFGYFAGNYPLEIDGNIFIINCVSMGNPHCVIFLNDDQDIYSIPIEKWGPLIETDKIFPKKTNVEFIKVNNPHKISMRVWERGVGETLACGTGASASAVCSILLGKVTGNNICVNLPGGNLNIIWEGLNNPVFLDGPVDYVFEGDYFL